VAGPDPLEELVRCPEMTMGQRVKWSTNLSESHPLTHEQVNDELKDLAREVNPAASPGDFDPLR